MLSILRSLRNPLFPKNFLPQSPNPPKPSNPHFPFVHFPEPISHGTDRYQETHIIYVGLKPPGISIKQDSVMSRLDTLGVAPRNATLVLF